METNTSFWFDLFFCIHYLQDSTIIIIFKVLKKSVNKTKKSEFTDRIVMLKEKDHVRQQICVPTVFRRSIFILINILP